MVNPARRPKGNAPVSTLRGRGGRKTRFEPLSTLPQDLALGYLDAGRGGARPLNLPYQFDQPNRSLAS